MHTDCFVWLCLFCVCLLLDSKHHSTAIFFGVTGHSLVCFSDQLSQRVLHVKKEEQSHFFPLAIKGVPQGSELISVLFTDTPNFINCCILIRVMVDSEPIKLGRIHNVQEARLSQPPFTHVFTHSITHLSWPHSQCFWLLVVFGQQKEMRKPK